MAQYLQLSLFSDDEEVSPPYQNPRWFKRANHDALLQELKLKLSPALAVLNKIYR